MHYLACLDCDRGLGWYEKEWADDPLCYLCDFKRDLKRGLLPYMHPLGYPDYPECRNIEVLEDMYEEFNVKFYRTDEYHKFKMWETNRPIKRDHSYKLSKAMKEINLNEFYPILCFEDMTIFDGQHRFSALKNNKLPVIFRIVPSKLGLNALLAANQNVKKWDIESFILVYCKLEKPDYIRLKKDLDDLGTTTSCVAISLTGSSGALTSEITNGKLIYREDHSKRVRELIIEAFSLPFKFKHDARFVRAYRILKMKKGFNLEHLKAQVEKYGKQFEKESLSVKTKNSYCFYLESVYNYKQPEALRLEYTRKELDGEVVV